MGDHDHEWGSWISAGILPNGNREYIRQCLYPACQTIELKQEEPT